MKKKLFYGTMVLAIGIMGAYLLGYLDLAWQTSKINRIGNEISHDKSNLIDLLEELKKIKPEKPGEPVIIYRPPASARAKASNSNFQPQVVSCSSSDCHK